MQLTRFDRYCEKCGRGPEYFLTRHHANGVGKPTVILCRSCHDLTEGIIRKDLVRPLAIHMSHCDICYCLFEALRKHAQLGQAEIHKYFSTKESPEGRRVANLGLHPATILRENEKVSVQ